MIRRKAKEITLAGNMTYGELQELIDNCDRARPCKINKNITRGQALTIMEGAIKGKEPSERPNTTRFHRTGRLILTGDGVNVMNILIECG